MFQISEPIRYKNKQTKYEEGVLNIKQARLPFDIALESLKPFSVLSSGHNYSSTGMRIHFTRNTFGLLVGGYYVPTMIFTLLSLVSYTINSDMVSIKTSRDNIFSYITDYLIFFGTCNNEMNYRKVSTRLN